MGYRIKITANAHNDLDEIVSYIIGELNNLSAAAAFLEAVEKVYQNLCDTPCMYSLCQKLILSRQGFRKAPISGYLMIYKVDEEKKLVYIERFFSHLEDYENLL